MDLNIILSISSLAISVGGLVPVFFLPERKKAVVFGVVISFLILLSAVGVFRAVQHRSEIRYVSIEVQKVLGKSPSTINQLEQSLHHVGYALLLEAVDNLVRSGKIQYQVEKLYDAERNAYFVGVYSVPTLQ